MQLYRKYRNDELFIATLAEPLYSPRDAWIHRLVPMFHHFVTPEVTVIIGDCWCCRQFQLNNLHTSHKKSLCHPLILAVPGINTTKNLKMKKTHKSQL